MHFMSHLLFISWQTIGPTISFHVTDWSITKLDIFRNLFLTRPQEPLPVNDANCFFWTNSFHRNPKDTDNRERENSTCCSLLVEIMMSQGLDVNFHVFVIVIRFLLFGPFCFNIFARKVILPNLGTFFFQILRKVGCASWPHEVRYIQDPSLCSPSFQCFLTKVKPAELM